MLSSFYAFTVLNYTWPNIQGHQTVLSWRGPRQGWSLFSAFQGQDLDAHDCGTRTGPGPAEPWTTDHTSLQPTIARCHATSRVICPTHASLYTGAPCENHCRVRATFRRTKSGNLPIALLISLFAGGTFQLCPLLRTSCTSYHVVPRPPHHHRTDAVTLPFPVAQVPFLLMRFPASVLTWCDTTFPRTVLSTVLICNPGTALRTVLPYPGVGYGPYSRRLRPVLAQFQPQNCAVPYSVLRQYGTIRKAIAALRRTLPRTVGYGTQYGTGYGTGVNVGYYLLEA